MGRWMGKWRKGLSPALKCWHILLFLSDQNNSQEPSSNAHGTPSPFLQLFWPEKGTPRDLNGASVLFREQLLSPKCNFGSSVGVFCCFVPQGEPCSVTTLHSKLEEAKFLSSPWQSKIRILSFCNIHHSCQSPSLEQENLGSLPVRFCSTLWLGVALRFPAYASLPFNVWMPNSSFVAH